IVCSPEAACVVSDHDVFIGAEREATAAISLALSSRDVSRWPADARISVSTTDNHWSVDISRRELAKSGRFTIHAPAGEYDVVIEAPRHRRWKQRVRLHQETRTVTARLEPLPSITGRIVARVGAEPIPGAAIVLAAMVVAIFVGS